MTRFIFRFGINTIAIYLLLKILPNIQVSTNGWALIVVMALILGLINTLVAPPILDFIRMKSPIWWFAMIANLGLFTLLFWLTGQIGKLFGYGYSAGIVPSLIGGLVLFIVDIIFGLWDDSHNKKSQNVTLMSGGELFDRFR
jgi:uncharacterized membrane protein YvlD (DUF360 family)